MPDTNLGDEYSSSAQFYDNVEFYRERKDVAFYVRAAVEFGGPVLELGCGTGRLLIHTARAGIDVTGVDSSPAMLDRCREKLSAEPDDVRRRVTLAPGDMRSFDLGKKFALIIVPFRPFQHLLTVEDELACLERVHTHLSPGGRFILDLFNPSLEILLEDSVGRETEEREVLDLPDGRKVRRMTLVREKDLINQIIRSELVYYVTQPDGREERLVQPLALRYLFRYEAEHLLERAGFAVEHVYGDFDISPFGEGASGEIVMIARGR
ncbi:MAG: class I SAM-dependent methyltransferase [Spirochaetales bacterium]|nr:class I SAM-dependent methyltransferase [Spirochaetales bacterium]